MPNLNYRAPRPPIHVIGPSIAYIVLTRGQVCLVDADIADDLGKFLWLANWAESSRKFYAKRRFGSKQEFLHHFILNHIPPLMVDHINGNTLDNRRSNLQLISRQGNSHKGCVQKNNTSGSRGVSFHSRDNMWQAGICINKKTRHLGTFLSQQEAIDVYNIAKEELLDSLGCVAPKNVWSERSK